MQGMNRLGRVTAFHQIRHDRSPGPDVAEGARLAAYLRSLNRILNVYSASAGTPPRMNGL